MISSLVVSCIISGFITNIVCFIILTTNVPIEAEVVDQALVDYYLELIQNHTLVSQNIEYPNDARMYEPESTSVRGMILLIYLSFMLLFWYYHGRIWNRFLISYAVSLAVEELKEKPVYKPKMQIVVEHVKINS